MNRDKFDTLDEEIEEIEELEEPSSMTGKIIPLTAGLIIIIFDIGYSLTKRKTKKSYTGVKIHLGNY